MQVKLLAPILDTSLPMQGLTVQSSYDVTALLRFYLAEVEKGNWDHVKIQVTGWPSAASCRRKEK
jgi:hypothetical protein